MRSEVKINGHSNHFNQMQSLSSKMPPKKYGTIEEGSLRVSLGIGSLFRDDLHLVDLAQTKANKTIWVVYKVDISTSDTTQTTLNEEEVYSTMLSLISTDDLDCLDIRGLSLFRVTKRLHDTAGKGCKKSENRNVAVPIKKLETFTIGEEYFFVLVDNRSIVPSYVPSLHRFS